jgi:DNA anti-recombination protein RmuC
MISVVPSVVSKLWQKYKKFVSDIKKSGWNLDRVTSDYGTARLSAINIIVGDDIWHFQYDTESESKMCKRSPRYRNNSDKIPTEDGAYHFKFMPQSQSSRLTAVILPSLGCT